MSEDVRCTLLATVAFPTYFCRGTLCADTFYLQYILRAYSWIFPWRFDVFTVIKLLFVTACYVVGSWYPPTGAHRLEPRGNYIYHVL
jgi:hypothetical protein